MTEVGNVYGQSLYELAKDEGLSREIGEQLTVLQKSFGEERILSVCSPTPAFPSRSGADSGHQLPRLGASLYSEFYENSDGKRLYPPLSDCCDAFSELYNRDNGILKVAAVTAVAPHPGAGGEAYRKAEPITGKTDRAPQSH